MKISSRVINNEFYMPDSSVFYMPDLRESLKIYYQIILAFEFL